MKERRDRSRGKKEERKEEEERKKEEEKKMKSVGVAPGGIQRGWRE